MNRPAPVEVQYKHLRFLITHNPTDATMGKFIEMLKQFEADIVVRVCEPTYDKSHLLNNGITVKDWPYDDGTSPPSNVIDDWLALLKAHMKEHPKYCVAVHCVAGLGRAPVLVAVALMEAGMKYEDAVDFIRQRRKGAINTKQLQYLEKYKPKYYLKPKKKSLKFTKNGKERCENCVVQ